MFTIHSFDWSASLFRMCCDSQGKVLAIELRDTLTQTVSFGVLDLQQGQWLLPETGMTETWRVGLSAVEDNFLVIHSFTHSNYPDNKGIVVVDYTHTEIIWDAPQLYYDHIGKTPSHNKVVCTYDMPHNPHEKSYWSLADGQKITTMPLLFEAFSYPIHTPRSYQALHPAFSTMQHQLYDLVRLRAHTQIDYVEWQSLFVTGFYLEEEKKSYYLAIFNNKKELIWHKNLQISGVLSEPPFSIIGKTLVIIETLQQILVITQNLL